MIFLLFFLLLSSSGMAEPEDSATSGLLSWFLPEPTKIKTALDVVQQANTKAQEILDKALSMQNQIINAGHERAKQITTQAESDVAKLVQEYAEEKKKALAELQEYTAQRRVEIDKELNNYLIEKKKKIDEDTANLLTANSSRWTSSIIVSQNQLQQREEESLLELRKEVEKTKSILQDSSTPSSAKYAEKLQLLYICIYGWLFTTLLLFISLYYVYQFHKYKTDLEYKKDI